MLPYRPVRACAVALLTALAAAQPAATGARATGRDTGPTALVAARAVSGGRLDWGIKASFQSYVTGPIAKGSWTLRDGAGTVGADQFRFHSATGSYDPDSGALTARFSGGVHFLGHRGSDGRHELDLTIARPAVRISDGRGTLFADMASRAKGSGTVTSARQVPLATLDLTGVDMRGGGAAVHLAAIPARLTARGAEAFAGYYTAGTPLDPVSLSVDVTAGRAEPGAKASPRSPRTSPPAEATANPRSTFTGAAVDWGVRRTFREYVTGPIAKGTWRLTGGAEDGGALFRFPAGRGRYDSRDGTLRADFTGRLHFTGRDVDLTLDDPSVRIADGTGTLRADVTEGGETTHDTPLVTFTATGLRPADGLITLREAPARLTAEGAKAFGRMYPPGTVMDPVSLAVPVDDAARLPALPDLGADPQAPAAPPRAAAKEPGSGAYSWPALPLAAVAAAALLATGGAVLLVRRRRAAALAAGPDAPDGAAVSGEPDASDAPGAASGD